jgi:hypothetical protein
MSRAEHVVCRLSCVSVSRVSRLSRAASSAAGRRPGGAARGRGAGGRRGRARSRSDSVSGSPDSASRAGSGLGWPLYGVLPAPLRPVRFSSRLRYFSRPRGPSRAREDGIRTGQSPQQAYNKRRTTSTRTRESRDRGRDTARRHLIYVRYDTHM